MSSNVRGEGMLKVRNILSFIAIASVVGIGLHVVHDVGIMRKSENRLVQMTVTFTHPERVVPVGIALSIAGKTRPEHATVSPWVRMESVKPGTVILLGATQSHDGKLTCKIQYYELDGGAYDERFDAGRVDCRFTA
jgi:hypothetical protein